MTPFNILIITQDDPFYVRLFFEEFLKHYQSKEEIKSVVIAPAMGKKNLKKLIVQMYHFYGPVYFFKTGLKYVLYKMGDFISRYIVLERFYSISQLCRYYNVPVVHCNDVNSKSFLDTIRAFDLDLIVSVAAPQIFKEPLILVPRKGCINIHNSKLPKYRGMMPNFWQMLNGEKTVGITIHRINSGIDDGEILLQKETTIIDGESLDALIRRTKRLGATFMIDAIQSIKTNTVRPLPNPSASSTYYSFPSKNDVMEFRKKGFRLI
jgi:methionyl-tRNA formyltransferase